MKRTQERIRNFPGRKKRNRVIYIICEGELTEKRYFKKFRKRGLSIDIIPVKSKHKRADMLVENALNSIGDRLYSKKDKDEIWCVFDRDANTDAILRKAARIAEEKRYHIAFSNPAFEIWFLYHFVDQRAELGNCDDVIRLLGQPERLEHYKKGQDVYDTLIPRQAAAMERARRRLASLEESPIIRGSNPCTTVVDLVEFLNGLQ